MEPVKDWKEALAALPPMGYYLASLELDTRVTVVMQNGASITGEVNETDHPALLVLYTANRPGQRSDYFVVDTGHVVAARVHG